MLHSGPAGQLEFESNRLGISIKHKQYPSVVTNKQSNLRHASAAQYKKPAGLLRMLIDGAPACACTCTYIRTCMHPQKKGVWGSCPPPPPPPPPPSRLRGPCYELKTRQSLLAKRQHYLAVRTSQGKKAS